MTFVTNNVKYYATVSAGSTTEQINGKPYTITAVPTSETYNGNTVYEITSITNYAGDYILANSGTKLLTNDDIKGMSKQRPWHLRETKYMPVTDVNSKRKNTANISAVSLGIQLIRIIITVMMTVILNFDRS